MLQVPKHAPFHGASTHPTMREVASVAGVSIKTVSRVVNAEGSVSAAASLRVHEAVEQLGYRHNLHARNLRRSDRRTATIGLLLAGVSDAYSSILRYEIESLALERHVLVFSGSSHKRVLRESALIEAFSSHRVDGLIVVGAVHNRAQLLAERRAGVPIVWVEQVSSSPDADSVRTDLLGGVRLAAKHLTSYAHRRIAHLQSAGRRGAIEEAIPELMSGDSPPTALFAHDGQSTLNAHRALRRLGLERQVALIGFDDVFDLELQASGVSVISPDPGAIGRVVAEVLFHRIDGDESAPIERLVPCRLIARGSGEIRLAQIERR